MKTEQFVECNAIIPWISYISSAEIIFLNLSLSTRCKKYNNDQSGLKTVSVRIR